MTSSCMKLTIGSFLDTTTTTTTTSTTATSSSFCPFNRSSKFLLIRGHTPSFLQCNQYSHSHLHLHSPNLNSLPLRRCPYRLSPNASSAALELPLLPFSFTEVLVPSERKTLHLFEARYLALLEDSLSRRKKLFVHFVLVPISMPGSSDDDEPSFAARYGCLVLIENVERLDVGALVTIRGICRVDIVNILEVEPYLIGAVVPIQDKDPHGFDELCSKVAEVKEALVSLNSLEIKLRTPKEAPLQAYIANSLMWAEREPSLECDEAFIPSLAERMSFAAFQPIAGLTKSDELNLQKEKLRAMDVRETLQRLHRSLEVLKENTAMLAAKLAIQSLELD